MMVCGVSAGTEYARLISGGQQLRPPRWAQEGTELEDGSQAGSRWGRTGRNGVVGVRHVLLACVCSISVHRIVREESVSVSGGREDRADDGEQTDQSRAERASL